MTKTLEDDKPRKWYAHMERKIVSWASIEECRRGEAIVIFKDMLDNLGNIMEYKEPEGVKISLRKVINDSVLDPEKEPENIVGPKPPDIPDFDWDVKFGP